MNHPMYHGHHEPVLVIVSVLVAMLASYTALSLALRVRQAHGRARACWIGGGALAMGSGIWAMHFIGMLAFRLPIPVGYEIGLTAASWVLALVASGLALGQVRHARIGRRQLAGSALLMGFGINAMHYTGMAAMRMDPAIAYDPWLFAASVLIAVGASALALQIGLRLNVDDRRRRGAQVAAAVIMGGAIAGMHYTGMAAAHFEAGSVCRAALAGIDLDHLAAIVTVLIVALLTIALLVTVFDARLAARNRIVADALAAAAERERLYLIEQTARMQAESVNRMKDEFLSTLSHELRTPLNAMLGWSQLLLQGAATQAPPDGMLRRGLETIERNARAQAQLIDDMLDMSRLIAGEVQIEAKPVKVQAVLQAALECARPLALARRIEIDASADVDAATVVGDAGRLQQVMAILLSNAVKFSEPGGRIELKLRRAGDQLAIDVADSGAGIAPEFLPFVFDRFRQADATSARRHGGLGLGLAIARALVELQGGAMSVASAGLGQGATFTLRLPLAGHDARASSAAAPSGLGERICL